MKSTFRRIRVVAAALLLLPSIFQPTLAQTQLKLTLRHSSVAGTPRADGSVKFAELAKAMSNGRIAIEINPDGKLGENLEMLTQLRAGTLDLSVNAHGNLSNFVPEVGVLGLPYAFSSPQQAWEILDGPLGKDLAKRTEAQGMITLCWMENGARQLSNNRRPILKPDDVRGLKIRTSTDKAMMDMVKMLGGVPVPTNFGDLYEAMRIGYVDGQDNPLVNFKQKKMHEVQKYLSITFHSFGLAPLLMSTKAWSALSSDDKKTILVAAQDACAYQRKMAAEVDEKILEEYKNNSAVTISFPDRVPFKAATQKVWDAWELKPFGDFVRKLRAATVK